MAGWANRINQRQQGIVIAIRGDAHHIEEIARRFPLGPQTLFGPRIKGHFAGFFGFRQRLLIHIAQHQHFTRNGVLHDDRHQTVGFLPIQLFT